MSRKRGIYLLQEKGCLNPQSGAFHHIKIGLAHLNKSFNINLFINDKRIDIESLSAPQQNTSATNSFKRGSILKGSIKDLMILFIVILSIPRLYRSLKKYKPDFIYERASYLNFAGLIVSRLLRIPLFYEANGLQFESKRKYYDSIFTVVIKMIEKWQYKKSTHTFFVGTYGHFWKLSTNNWTNVENGIEKELISSDVRKKIEDGDVHLVFLGSLMYHHRPDILKEALCRLKNKNIHLHLVGNKLDKLYQDLLDKRLKVTNHGYIERNCVNKLISKFHIGIIAGSPEYNSNMKLFDYGLAKCCVLAADVDVLTSSFKHELFFFNRTAEDMVLKMEQLIEDATMCQDYGELIYNKVVSQYTWDLIFKHKTQVINSIINQN